MLTYKTPPGDPIPLVLDRDRMQQVVTNLVANAIEYTGAGRTVEVRTERRPEDDLVVVQVIDDGPQPPPKADLQRLFEPGYQPPSSNQTTPRQRLGLSIAKTLVELHGGHIQADHNALGGLTFTFDLPTKTRTAYEAAAAGH